MIPSLVIITVALVAALFLFRLVRGSVGERRIQSLHDLNGQTLPVDLEAFQNLISASEDAFLRSALDARHYRRLQRMRTKATIEYLDRVAHNAAVLLRLGEAAREATQPEVAEAARQLANTALAVRINVLLALVRLRLLLVFPAGNDFCAQAIAQYAALKDVLGALGKLQDPALNARLSSGL